MFIGTSNERTCLENGNWTNVEFHCQLQDCGIPKFLRNGFVKYNSTVFGSRAEYSCKKGDYHSLRKSAEQPLLQKKDSHFDCGQNLTFGIMNFYQNSN